MVTYNLESVLLFIALNTCKVPKIWRTTDYRGGLTSVMV